MIEIIDKSQCCGCGACVQICPKHCLEMREDEEGFLYPQGDPAACIHCRLCKDVCPELNLNETRKPLKTYAALNGDASVRAESSSGGVFSILAQKVIEKGGIVFGAGFDEHWKLMHSATETKEGLKAFRMSKYIQSDTGSTFREAEDELKKGRLVLYSGTPCQIAGLRNFLRKEYDNLLTLDIICHGVPSPGVFRWYLSEEITPTEPSDRKRYKVCDLPHIPSADELAAQSGYAIKSIEFRNKQAGWRNFSFSLKLETLATGPSSKEKFEILSEKGVNSFLKGFLNDLYLRPSCHDCPTKELKSGSDFTLGDYWGIEHCHPELDDDKGTSVMMVHTPKGLEFLEEDSFEKKEIDFEDVVKYNTALTTSSPLTSRRAQFFATTSQTFTQKVEKICKPGMFVQIRKKLKSLIR